MTKTERSAIISKIDASTDYNAATIIIHRDGRISGILDADKTFGGPHALRLLIGYVEDFRA